MKKLFILFLFSILTVASYAQENHEDVVYLKNGSIIRGIIIEQVPNQSIKIETADRSVYIVQTDEIEKITKEPIEDKTDTVFKKGYKGMVVSGYQKGVGHYGADRLRLDMINGYQISPNFSIGIGTGMRYYKEAAKVLVPVFANFITNFTDHKISPYLSLGTGYTLDASADFEGVGLLLNPEVGISFKVVGKSSLNIGLGYEMQRLDAIYYAFDYYTSFYYNYSASENTGAVSLTAGISF